MSQSSLITKRQKTNTVSRFLLTMNSMGSDCYILQAYWLVSTPARISLRRSFIQPQTEL